MSYEPPIHDPRHDEDFYREQSEGDCSAATCSACLNWEPRQNSGMGDGYCQIFDKITDPDHGKRCTAFQPNVPHHPRQPGSEAGNKSTL